MASEKGLYWLAVGVMTLVFVNSEIMHGWLGNVQDRAIEVAERISGHSIEYVNLADMESGSHSGRCPRAQAIVIQLQGKLAKLDTAFAREQAGLARFEANRDRIQAKFDCATAALARKQATFDRLRAQADDEDMSDATETVSVETE